MDEIVGACGIITGSTSDEFVAAVVCIASALEGLKVDGLIPQFLLFVDNVEVALADVVMSNGTAFEEAAADTVPSQALLLRLGKLTARSFLWERTS